MESWTIFRPVPFTDADYESASSPEDYQRIWNSYLEPIGSSYQPLSNVCMAIMNWPVFAPAPFLCEKLEETNDPELFQELWSDRLKEYSVANIPTTFPVQEELDSRVRAT